jgi:hypothetical protein
METFIDTIVIDNSTFNLSINGDGFVMQDKIEVVTIKVLVVKFMGVVIASELISMEFIKSDFSVFSA